MNVVDSSGWLEFLVDGPNRAHFAGAITDAENLVVPTVCLYEVFKKVLGQRSESDALKVVAFMMRGLVVPMDDAVAISAARLGHEYRIPFADAVILATARYYAAVIWTQDEHFSGIPGVKFFAHAARRA